MQTAPPILQVNQLTVERNRQTILAVESFTIDEREVLAIVGPNGAGKSTLLLTLGCLLSPQQGQVLFHGQQVTTADTAYRRRIALVFQDPLLLDTTVFDNVATGLYYRGFSKKKAVIEIEPWLEVLGIAHLRDRRARSLSGGEAQRVSLARAFTLRPEILLLDEPFSALDTPTRIQLIHDLQTILSKTAMTTLFVTHDLNEALTLGTRLAVMIGGHITQSGPPEEVIASPCDAQTAAFLGVENILPGKVMKKEEGILLVDCSGVLFESIGETEINQDVYLCVRPEDVTILNINTTHRTSARNCLSGKVEHISYQGPLARIELDCKVKIIASITRSSVKELNISPGSPITASIKATAIHLIERSPSEV